MQQQQLFPESFLEKNPFPSPPIVPRLEISQEEISFRDLVYLALHPTGFHLGRGEKKWPLEGVDVESEEKGKERLC